MSNNFNSTTLQFANSYISQMQSDFNNITIELKQYSVNDQLEAKQCYLYEIANDQQIITFCQNANVDFNQFIKYLLNRIIAEVKLDDFEQSLLKDIIADL